MKKEDVITGVRKELDKIDSMAFAKYKDHINECFDLSTHYDMYLKIAIVNNKACIHTHERGICIYEYFTGSVDEVIFAILDNVIGLMASKMTWERYADKEKGILLCGEEESVFLKETEEKMFSQLDNKYSEWYKRGYNWLRMPGSIK